MRAKVLKRFNNNRSNYKKQFPIFSNNPGLVYLDSAATTQKPKSVIRAISDFYSKHNANVHRGLYPLSEKSTEMYEDARRTVAKFINAEPEEIIFTSSSTDGLNAIAQMLKNSGLLNNKPKIVLSELEHHSNILPWQQLNPKSIEYLMLNSDYILGNSLLGIEADILALTHVSNVTGTILPIEEIVKNADQIKFKVLDASQSVGHMKIDVKKLDVDFLVFSGHKAYGPTGIGVIYGKKHILEELSPYRVGGGMIKEVKRDKSTWAEIPEKFEAGTPPIADAIALAESLKFLTEITFQKIEQHEQELRKYMLEKLGEIKQVNSFHPPINTKALGIFAFTVDGIHPHDVAQFLGDRNICVRAGHHCTQILHREVLNIPASVRASLGIYNTKKDIDVLVEGLKAVINYYL